MELDATGAVVATSTFGASGLVSRHTTSSTFYAFDPQGSVAQRLDASGTVLSSHQFKAHGSELTTASADPFGYGAQWGYYTDRETGLQLLTNRYYDPSTGRFVTRDPISYAGGMNLYGYVRNNPLTSADPSGLDGWGNDFADWLDQRIDYSRRYWHYGDEHWIANGTIDSVAQFTYGYADLFRVGSGVGHALYDCDDNGYGRAANVAMDVVRAAGIFEMLAGPLAERVGPANCFVAGTLVETVGGAKPIEQVKAGDVVLSADAGQSSPVNQVPQQQEVTRTFVRTATEVIEIHLGKETITATPEHPFWVVGAGWTAAGELRRGSALLTKDGVIVHIDYVDRREGKFQVYNFEVGSSHTYYVCRFGILVHNQCEPRFNPDQDALIQLAKRAKRTGVSPDQADTLLNWANEYGVQPALDHTSAEDAAHWLGGRPHIHVGPRHIEVK